MEKSDIIKVSSESSQNTYLNGNGYGDGYGYGNGNGYGYGY